MVKVTLSQNEATALKMAGNAEDNDVQHIIYLTVAARGMAHDDAIEVAAVFAAAALTARHKIREATAYEIVIGAEGESHEK